MTFPRVGNAPSSLPSATIATFSAAQRTTTTVTSTVFSSVAVAARLSSPADPGRYSGVVAAFVFRSVQVTTTRYTAAQFSVCRDAAPRKAGNPVDKMATQAQQHAAFSMLFQRQTTVTVTVSVVYFGFVCQGQRPAVPAMPASTPTPKLPGPMPTPAPQPTPKLAQGPQVQAAAPQNRPTLRPVDGRTPQPPEDWKDLAGVKSKAARYDVWRTLNAEQPSPLEVTRKPLDGQTAAPPLTLKPKSIAPEGESFTGTTAQGESVVIPFDQVEKLRVK
jgi:hypothetical protein